MKIQFLDPNITSQDIQKATEVLKSGWLILGEKTKEFETKFAKYLGAKEAVATSSAACSLHLSLILAGVAEGDEVITPPLSYVSTSNPILYQGAKPVFVDVEEDTGLIDLDKVEKAITKKTKAIIPVHLYGQMVDMKKLKKIADRHRLIIIEDSSHAIETKRDGIRPGQLGDYACFSFHVAKNITAGNGGAIITNNKKAATLARLLRRDGIMNIGDKRRMYALGYKYLMTDFQAAMLSNQLDRIEKQWRRREKIFRHYAAAFKKIGVNFPKIVPNSKSAYHVFVVWVNPQKRDEIRRKLAASNIDTSIHYDPIHLEPYYKKRFGYKKGDFPVTERLGFSTITLPFHLKLTSAQQNYVVRKVKESL